MGNQAPGGSALETGRAAALCTAKLGGAAVGEMAGIVCGLARELGLEDSCSTVDTSSLLAHEERADDEVRGGGPRKPRVGGATPFDTTASEAAASAPESRSRRLARLEMAALHAFDPVVFREEEPQGERPQTDPDLHVSTPRAGAAAFHSEDVHDADARTDVGAGAVSCAAVAALREDKGEARWTSSALSTDEGSEPSRGSAASSFPAASCSGSDAHAAASEDPPLLAGHVSGIEPSQQVRMPSAAAPSSGRGAVDIDATAPAPRAARACRPGAGGAAFSGSEEGASGAEVGRAHETQLSTRGSAQGHAARRVEDAEAGARRSGSTMPQAELARPGAIVEVYSATLARWHVGRVVASAPGEVVVQFVSGDGAVCQKALRPCDLGGHVAELGAHLALAAPPGFSMAPSASRPGEFTYADGATGLRYRSAEHAWAVHLDRVLPRAAPPAAAAPAPPPPPMRGGALPGRAAPPLAPPI